VDTDGTSCTPLLDEWIAEVGEAAVAAIVTEGIAQVENGMARDLIDKDAYGAWAVGRLVEPER